MAGVPASKDSMKLHEKSSSHQHLIRKETLTQWPDDILLVDLDDVGTSEWPTDRCIALTDRLETKATLQAVRQSGIHHIIQLSNPKLNQSLQMAAHMITQPRDFIDRAAENIFGPQRENLIIERFPFRNSRQKATTLQQVKGFIETFVSSSQVLGSVDAIADELYTNAMFGAPVNPAGRRKHLHLHRSSHVELDTGASAELLIAKDDQALLVACEDTYGSLTTDSILERLIECHEKGVGNVINLGEGGTGIGLFLMIEYTTSFFMIVQPGKKTIIGGLIPYRLPGKLRAAVPKNFHILVAPGK